MHLKVSTNGWDSDTGKSMRKGQERGKQGRKTSRHQGTKATGKVSNDWKSEQQCTNHVVLMLQPTRHHIHLCVYVCMLTKLQNAARERERERAGRQINILLPLYCCLFMRA